MSAKVIPVIRAEVHRGTGTEADRHRIVVQYSALDGTLLWENDPCANSAAPSDTTGMNVKPAVRPPSDSDHFR